MPSFAHWRRHCVAWYERTRPTTMPNEFTFPWRGPWSTAAFTSKDSGPGKYTHAAALNKVYELESQGKDAFVWIGLHEPDEHQMQAVADVFCPHELAVEDAVHAHQRPKLERYDETLFLVLKTVNYVEHVSVPLAREIVETGEIMIFVGPDFVVTVRHGDHSGLSTVRKHLEASPALLKLGPYAVMHAISDHVVDSYLDVTDLVG
jgi:magnesium transporter